MATIDSKEFIDQIIAGNGWHPDTGDQDALDNPRVAVIVEYTNAFGVITYGVTFVNQPNIEKYVLPTYYVRNPKVIWRASEHPL